MSSTSNSTTATTSTSPAPDGALGHHRAHDVRHPGSAARSRAGARSQQPAGVAPRVAVLGRHEMAENRRAGGRDALAADSVVVPRIASSSNVVAGAGTGSTPCAVRTVPPPSGSDVAVQRAPSSIPRCSRRRRRRAANPSRRARGNERPRRDAVHARLGVAEQREQRERVLSRRRRQRRGLDAAAKRRVRGADALLVSCRAIRAVDALRFRQSEPPCPQARRSTAR
jgi:hypothetical protein